MPELGKRRDGRPLLIDCPAVSEEGELAGGDPGSMPRRHHVFKGVASPIIGPVLLLIFVRRHKAAVAELIPPEVPVLASEAIAAFGPQQAYAA